MKKEEAELRLKKYHSKIFAKHPDKNSKAMNDNDFDGFDVFGSLSKQIVPSAPLKLLDALLVHLKMNTPSRREAH